MAKEIKVTLLDKDTIRIEEEAKIGDYIYLNNLANIDTTAIEKLIQEGKDLVYQKRLNEEIEKSKRASEVEKKLAIAEALTKQKDELQKEIAKLNSELSKKDSEKDFAILKKEKELKEEFSLEKDKLEKDYQDKLSKANEEFNAINTELGILKATKVRLNNKEIGEDLEGYCNDVVNNMMQIGYDNCTWYKDNQSIKEDGEAKGTKADFIYKIYLDNTHNGEPLSSICLEMKNEALESNNKKKNSDHYKKLDTDRNKKECKYALLVSNLESDNDNILPIYKVNGYHDMYVVRPAYLTTFLTIITSLTMKFKDIITASENQALDLATKNEFIAEYDRLRNTYLDKPLKALQDELENIRKASITVIDAATKINLACDNIVRRYINEISDKLEKYQSAMIKSYKKLDK